MNSLFADSAVFSAKTEWVKVTIVNEESAWSRGLKSAFLVLFVIGVP